MKRNLLRVVLLVMLAVVLAIQLQRVIGERVYEARVRTVLTTAETRHGGAYLGDVRVQRMRDRMLVVAVYRTPAPFAPAEVGAPKHNYRDYRE